MTKLRISKKSKGFTLVEILTVVFLGTIIIIVSYTVYLMSYKSYQKNSVSSELTQNARISLERMSREIRQANEILTNLPENQTGAPSEIKFQDGHVITPIQYIRYYISGTDLHREVSHYCLTPCTEWVPWSTQNADEYIDLDQIKAEKISSLQFWGEGVITLRLAVSDDQSTYTFETKTLTRNAQ